MMRREGGRVVIDISGDEYTLLLLALGVATGKASMPDRARDLPGALMDHFLRLANSINEGNPNWTPYLVDAPKAS